MAGDADHEGLSAHLGHELCPPGLRPSCPGEVGELATAILAGGCFWPAQELLRHREGVISTCVGYTGGEKDNPTADNHPGHAEAVEVIFDPERTSYRNILELFQIHRPDLGGAVVGSDYRSEIFYTSDEQRQVAEDMIADAPGFWGAKVMTKISKAGSFWEAAAGLRDRRPVSRPPGWQRYQTETASVRPAVPPAVLSTPTCVLPRNS